LQGYIELGCVKTLTPDQFKRSPQNDREWHRAPKLNALYATAGFPFLHFIPVYAPEFPEKTAWRAIFRLQIFPPNAPASNAPRAPSIHSLKREPELQ
jgi:hypothetical protein